MAQPSGFLADYDANQLTYTDAGVTLATNGQTVRQWNKLAASSGGANLAQATSGSRPTLVTNILNGLPVLRFDGVDDFVKASFTLSQPCTMAIVYASVSLGAAGSHDIIIDGASNATMVYSADNTQPAAGIYAGSGVAQTILLSAGTFYREIAVFSGGASKSIRDNVTVASGNAGTATPSGCTVGALANGGRSTQIDVARVIIYPSALDATNLAALDDYLYQTYFVPQGRIFDPIAIYGAEGIQVF